MIYDCVGVGFGPANMSLAIAFQESGQSISTRFLDARDSYSWHSDLLFPGATMQISFMKDLVTTANPRSPFTFVNFLHEAGRLHDFINLRTFYPRRDEFDAYLRWAADKLSSSVDYGNTVTSISLTAPQQPSNSLLKILLQKGESGQSQEIISRNVVIADGGYPNWPLTRPQKEYTRIFHGSQTLSRLRTLNIAAKSEAVFHIVGSGQSAADIFVYLSTTYPYAKIYMTHRGFAMRPEDDSHFVNELFMPDAVDLFQSLDQTWRDRIVCDNRNVTHNGVTLDMLPKLCESVYADRFSGAPRFTFNRLSELADAWEVDGLTVSLIRNLTTESTHELHADAIILATGYDRPCPHPLLGGLHTLFTTLPDDRAYDLDRSWRIKTTSPTEFGVFLQGYGERTHGFSEALLSLMPIRARAIADAVLGGSAGSRCAA